MFVRKYCTILNIQNCVLWLERSLEQLKVLVADKRLTRNLVVQILLLGRESSRMVTPRKHLKKD